MSSLELLSILMVLLLMMELDRETGIYKSHIEEWLKSHPGQFVLIKGDDVLGFFCKNSTAVGDFIDEQDFI